MIEDDAELRSRFDALRQLDGAVVPDVGAILGGRPVRRPPRAVLPAVVAAAAAIALLVTGLRFGESRASIDVSVSSSESSLLAWRSPTASLLQTPGSELMQTMPGLESSLLRSLP